MIDFPHGRPVDDGRGEPGSPFWRQSRSLTTRWRQPTVNTITASHNSISLEVSHADLTVLFSTSPRASIRQWKTLSSSGAARGCTRRQRLEEVVEYGFFQQFSFNNNDYANRGRAAHAWSPQAAARRECGCAPGRSLRLAMARAAAPAPRRHLRPVPRRRAPARLACAFAPGRRRAPRATAPDRVAADVVRRAALGRSSPGGAPKLLVGPFSCQYNMTDSIQTPNTTCCCLPSSRTHWPAQPSTHHPADQPPTANTHHQQVAVSLHSSLPGCWSAWCSQHTA